MSICESSLSQRDRWHFGETPLRTPMVCAFHDWIAFSAIFLLCCPFGTNSYATPSSLMVCFFGYMPAALRRFIGARVSTYHFACSHVPHSLTENYIVVYFAQDHDIFVALFGLDEECPRLIRVHRFLCLAHFDINTIVPIEGQGEYFAAVERDGLWLPLFLRGSDPLLNSSHVPLVSLSDSGKCFRTASAARWGQVA